MAVINYYDEFVRAESLLGEVTLPTPLVGKALYKFGTASNFSNNTKRVPIFVRTGQQAMGAPHERKRFTQIEFHGKGSLYVRVYVDSVLICDGRVSLTELPSKDRRLGIPTGTNGYTIDVEFCGNADVRLVEFDYKPMRSAS